MYSDSHRVYKFIKPEKNTGNWDLWNKKNIKGLKDWEVDWWVIRYDEGFDNADI